MKTYIIKFFKWVLSTASEKDGTGSSKRVIAYVSTALFCSVNLLAIKIKKPEVFTFIEFFDGITLTFILVLLGLATWNQIQDKKVE